MANDPQTATLLFTGGTLPEDFCPKNFQEMYDAFWNRLIAQFNSETATFLVSSVIPTSNQGPLFLNGTDIWVWDIGLGAYRPIVLSSVTGQVPVGTVVPWAGNIANAPANFSTNGAEWMHADGRAISRAAYPTYFLEVGTIWGVGDGITTVNIPDSKDMMIAGASADSAGKAMTTMADPAGVALLQSRVYMQHKHRYFNEIPNEGAAAAGGAKAQLTGLELTSTSVDGAEVSERVLPPFITMPFMVRVK